MKSEGLGTREAKQDLRKKFLSIARRDVDDGALFIPGVDAEPLPPTVAGEVRGKTASVDVQMLGVISNDDALYEPSMEPEIESIEA